MSWKRAAFWAVPIASWVSVVVVIGVLLPWQWHEWRNNVSLWPAAIEESRARGDAEMVAKQQAWLVRDERNGAITVAALGIVMALALAAPFAYRRLVPSERRAGARGILLTIPVLALIAFAGYLFLAEMFRGVIKG